MMPGSSSQAPSTLVAAHPFTHPLHWYLSKAVEGHAQIVAAITDHGEHDEAKRAAAAAAASAA